MSPTAKGDNMVGHQALHNGVITLAMPMVFDFLRGRGSIRNFLAISSIMYLFHENYYPHRLCFFLAAADSFELDSNLPSLYGCGNDSAETIFGSLSIYRIRFDLRLVQYRGSFLQS